MSINDKIKEVEELMARANKLLEEVKTVSNQDDVLTMYKKALEDAAYWLNEYNNIDTNITESLEFSNDASEDEVYGNYPSKKYAELAQKLKRFNDKLLAFKWCYDRDYEPNWGDIHNEAYYVYFDSIEKIYTWNLASIVMCNMVYFSSEEIVEKCCDWLNKLYGKE